MARVRLVSVPALLLLCSLMLVGAPSALAARAAAHHAFSHRGAHCARRAAWRFVHTRSFRGRRLKRCARPHPHSRGRRAPATHMPRRHTHAPARPLHATARGPSTRGSSADSSGRCTDASLSPSRQNVERVRAAVLCLINRERSSRGEVALVANARLTSAAQGHTESMAFGNYFEHTGPGGDTPLDRMRACGYIYSSQIGYEVGENIGWGTLSQGTPSAIVSAWMASPGHRANILDSRYRDTAVGVSPHPPSAIAHGQAGGIYTQDFGVIAGG